MKIMRIEIKKCSDCPKFESVNCDALDEVDYETWESRPGDGDCPPLEGCPLEDAQEIVYLKCSDCGDVIPKDHFSSHQCGD